MFLFLAGYLCIYGTLHLYVLIRVRRAYYLQGVHYILIVVVLLFFMVAPIQGRMLLAQEHVWSALALSWIGFIWMGFFFIFICLLIPLDLYHSVVSLGQRIIGADWTGLMLSRRQILGVSATLAFVLMVTVPLKRTRSMCGPFQCPAKNCPLKWHACVSYICPICTLAS